MVHRGGLRKSDQTGLGQASRHCDRRFKITIEEHQETRKGSNLVALWREKTWNSENLTLEDTETVTHRLRKEMETGSSRLISLRSSVSNQPTQRLSSTA